MRTGTAGSADAVAGGYCAGTGVLGRVEVPTIRARRQVVRDQFVCPGESHLLRKSPGTVEVGSLLSIHDLERGQRHSQPGVR